MLVGQGLSLLFQTAYFLIITRSLGAQQYGAFIAALAFAQLLAPFVGFGASNLLIKHVARDRNQFSVYWGNLLFMTIASGLVATGFLVAVARLVLPPLVPLIVVVCVSLAQLLFERLIDSGAMAFQAIERLDVSALVVVCGAFLRLVGIGALVFVLHAPGARQWSVVYLATSIVSAIGVLICVQMRVGGPRLALATARRDFLEGLSFSVSLSAQSVYNDIDKTMLARMATLDAVGIYAAAYRLIDVAFLPVRSLLNAAYPGFFRAGKGGMSGAVDYLRRLIPRPLVYSAAMCFCLMIGAPVIPHLFGADFARSVEALRWLSLLPLLKTLHYFLSDTLTCTGHQSLRASIQVLLAGFNVLINLWVIPAYSWRGAAWSSLASDGLLAVSMYLAVRLVSARPARDLAAGFSTV
jgi:O-antigen/teichoic acid export membrane protein